MADNKLNTEEVSIKEKKPYVTRISRDAIARKIKFFEDYGIPYVMKTTTERVRVFAEKGWGHWQNKESSFKSSELHFIKSIKQYVVKNETYKNVKNTFTTSEGKDIQNRVGKIKYYYYNKKLPEKQINDIYEIDLKNAYWRTAFKLGLIDEFLYQKGLTVTKKSRLAAIGTFNKHENVIVFDGKKTEVMPPETSPTTGFLWHTISYKVGKLMKKASSEAKNDFLFFWVDAIFIKGEHIETVKKIFKDADYDCTLIKCEWIKFDGKYIRVKSTAKGKTVKVKQKEKVIIGGRTFIKTWYKKEWRDERVFPYKKFLPLNDIMDIATQ